MIDMFFKALSEESRLRILSLLMIREMCVCEIETYLKMTQSNASRHLTILKNCGIIESYKQAQWAYFKIDERFKQDNKALWEYLQITLKQIRTYPDDFKEYEKYKGNDICTHIHK